jgi:hypothetical protein
VRKPIYATTVCTRNSCGNGATRCVSTGQLETARFDSCEEHGRESRNSALWCACLPMLDRVLVCANSIRNRRASVGSPLRDAAGVRDGEDVIARGVDGELVAGPTSGVLGTGSVVASDRYVAFLYRSSFPYRLMPIDGQTDRSKRLSSTDCVGPNARCVNARLAGAG